MPKYHGVIFILKIVAFNIIIFMTIYRAGFLGCLSSFARPQHFSELTSVLQTITAIERFSHMTLQMTASC